MMRARAVVTAVAVLALAACGDDGNGADRPAAPAGSVSLEITFADPDGERATAVLRCGDQVVADGWLARRDERLLCERARSLAPFLADEPDPGRACTQIYGGPQRARIRGRIDGRRVDRSFSRENGCRIADWERVGILLPRLR